MYIIRILFFAVIFLTSTQPAYAETLTKSNIDYKYTEMDTQINAVIPFENIIRAYGPRMTLAFDRSKKISGAAFSDRNGFDGYAQFARVRTDKKLIIAGLNHDRSDFWGAVALAPDNRQNFILMRDAAGGPVEKYKNLNDRLSLGLEVDHKNQSILLSSGRDTYTLTIFDAKLSTKKSINFGRGKRGNIALTQGGTYAVVGFDREVGAHVEYPMYWEFSPELELISQQRLSEHTKSTSQGDALMQVLLYKDNLYAAYGWDKSGHKKELSDEVHLKKIRGSSGFWSADGQLPYKTGGAFFISQSGNPFFLEPAQDGLRQTIFDQKTGKTSLRIFDKPNDRPQCFPPRWHYEIVDIFVDPDGNDNLVLSSNPLNHPEAGCVAIGITHF